MNLQYPPFIPAATNSPSINTLSHDQVYMGSILETKKRYVGHKFESESEEVGSLDAKGIEMVRRDQCGLVTKIQEKVARLLFTTRDLSLVKEYLQKQWEKILTGGDKLTLWDYRFSKEVKIGHYAQGYGTTHTHPADTCHPSHTSSQHTYTSNFLVAALVGAFVVTTRPLRSWPTKPWSSRENKPSRRATGGSPTSWSVGTPPSTSSNP